MFYSITANPTKYDFSETWFYAEKVQSWSNLETWGNFLYDYYSVWLLVPCLILLVAIIGDTALTMHRL